MIKISQDADWFDRVTLRLPFSFQPYYANANQLKHAKAILVVSPQLGRKGTPLPGNLIQTIHPFTIISFIIIIVFINNIIINIIFIIFNIAEVWIAYWFPYAFCFMVQIIWPPQPNHQPSAICAIPRFLIKLIPF